MSILRLHKGVNTPADRYFIDIGYTKTEDRNFVKFENHVAIIEFFKPTKSYSVYLKEGGVIYLRVKDHKAIGDKLKEMGWL